MKPIDIQQVQGSVQVLLTVLSDEKSSTPNNLIEGVVSGKSLLRAILQGTLVLCEPGAPATASTDDGAPQENEAEGGEDDGAEAP